MSERQNPVALKGKTPTNKQPGTKCTVCLAMEEMDPTDAEVLVGWLKNPRLTYSAIAETLRDDDDVPTLRADSLSKHATGKCMNREVLR